MGVGLKRIKSSGFAATEGLLMLIIVAAIAGVGYYVLHQKHSTEKTLSSSNSKSTGQANAPAGTTASVDQQATNSAKTEAGVDNSADSGYKQDATNANGAINSMGGAYNEANY